MKALPLPPPPSFPSKQALQNYWLSIWSEATAAAEAGGAEAALHTRFYMLLYFAFGLSSLVFQAGRPGPSSHNAFQTGCAKIGWQGNKRGWGRLQAAPTLLKAQALLAKPQEN